ncbi:pantetheine-phosphate adenylyltransferase [Nannizzia gypsea CBS 118893]|uniref:Pantetheine-phosphate adenylyltransferase n=1 Tax=Arthroderma gypseum (strain ATCC MYA-4604 / CBS 118893) TaxID=535722 RepID=E4V5L7_ARTGP|nr:pantetheine-phosphate adenylyltransferase [Nannizzia gypsea CBS 118893]EFR05392.1 pantetheine-phosphate adenylyltransferase [Nannizzia gypsea CBS 118893]
MEGRHEALLLLTDTPSTFAALRETYGHALSTILPALAAASGDGKKDSQPAVLDVAVSVCGKGKPFGLLQRFLADFYRLLAAVSVAVSVELDGPGGVDARVFFLELDSQTEPEPGDRCSYGPIVSMKSLIRSNRSWDTVYLPSGCESVASFAALLAARQTGDGRVRTTDIRTLELKASGDKPLIGLVLDQGIAQPAAAVHYSVAVGGTFDHLHAGHKLLLTATVLALDTCSPSVARSAQRDGQEKRAVTIGITGDELLVNKKYAEFLESWEDRWQGVWRFLQSIIEFSPSSTVDVRRENEPGPNGRRVIVSLSSDLEFRFVQIADPFGPTITDRDITALVVSKETRSGGKAVNDERLKKGWSALEVYEVDVLDTADGVPASQDGFETKISSTDIRRRRMNLAKGSTL